MFKIFRLLFIRNFSSVFTLFLVLILASTGFLVMRELTENIELLVAKETAPIFGADIIIGSPGYQSIPIIDRVRPILSNLSYTWGERKEFSTTLFDQAGKTGLIKVIAFSGSYPQKGVLETDAIGSFSGERISITPETLSRFALSGVIRMDERTIRPTATIRKSSELGLSLGSENHLIILPESVLSGSMLLSSGSRLSQDLLLTFHTGTDILKMATLLKTSLPTGDFRIRTYQDSSERTMGTVSELSKYTLLILVVAAIFSGIILRSAHDRLFQDFAHTLQVVEILGFSRKRQLGIFLLLYLLLISLSILISLGLSVITLFFIAKLPGAQDFVFLASPVFFTLEVFLILVGVGFIPAWSEKMNITHGFKIRFPRVLAISFLPKIQAFILPFFGMWAIVALIFEDVLWSLMVVFLGSLVLLFVGAILQALFRFFLRKSERFRSEYFLFYDGIRTLVRPLSPAIPIGISLIGMILFFTVFTLFSLAFREKLSIDTKTTTNIYTINILDQDIDIIRKNFPEAKAYSILQARIAQVNHQDLASFLHTPTPSREFSREFNVTLESLPEIPVVSGKKILEKGEVSVDAAFAKNLGVGLGDTIEFLVSGRSFSLKIGNLRKAVRDGLSPFFYFSFEKNSFATAPKTYFLAANVPDVELWKKQVLNLTGPHVTFIDVGSILELAKSIASKVLSVISLFFLSMTVFVFLALSALFGRFESIEHLKRRLYYLFGMRIKSIQYIFLTTRGTLIGISYSIGVIGGTLTFYRILLSSTVLTWNWNHVFVVIGGGALMTAGFLIISWARLKSK